MKLIRAILSRPMTVFLVLFAIVVFGVSSILGMPLEYLPDMNMPMEMVMVTWGGADADSIERLVTEPIEVTCETLTDVNTISSTTYDNYTMVQISYNYGVNLDDAYMELKAAMDNLAAELPDGCDDPTIMEISLSSQTTMSVSASAPEGVDVQAYLDDTVTPALERISGVARIEISGARNEYLRLVLDEAALDQYGLSISEVGAAIAAADFDMPLGNVTMGTQDIALSAYGSIDLATPGLRDLPIQTHSGESVRLEDLTSFFNLYREDADSISRYNGQDSVLINITKQDSASTVTVCREVENVLNQFAGEGISFQVINSEADSIMDTLSEIINTLITGVVLTMAVLLLFFGSIKASLIVGVSMPLSILLSVILLSLAGFSMDLMTGTAMIIAIGMIVDNSIVILESCIRSQENGLDFKEAAVQGTSEMFLSILAGTLTTVVVYVPLAMAQGMSGQMAAPLSWTISLTLLSSLLCAVVVVPLIFMLVRPTVRQDIPINRFLAKLSGFYQRVMPGLLKHPARVVVVAVAFFAASIALASQMEFVIFPSNYDGSIQLEADFRSGTRLEVMDEQIRELETALLNDDNFDNVTLEISGNTASFTAYAADSCTRSSVQAAEEYLQRFGDRPGMVLTVSPSSSGGMSSMMDTGNTVDVTLVADDLSLLEDGASVVEEAMAQIPGVLQVHNEFNQSRVQGRLVLDARKVQNAGMTQAQTAAQIRYYLSGMTAAQIDYGDETYDIILEYPEGRYSDISLLMDQSITSPTGRSVTISDVASIDYTTTLPSISRQDGQFITTITASTTETAKYDAGRAVNRLMAQLSLPAGVSQGTSAMDQMSNDEISNFSSTLLTAVFLVFLVMAIQFNSPRLSIMIMLCIPFSLIGSFGMLYLSGAPMSLLGMMGFLMLIGIAVNNGIYLVDGANALRRTMPLGQALIQAGITRLRPILMTTLTTMISMVPMLFSSDSSMGMMKEMAYIIIGGLAASTILAMFLMPPFYLLIRRERAEDL